MSVSLPIDMYMKTRAITTNSPNGVGYYLMINARIQQWMLDKLKKQGEVGAVLEYILETKAGFKYKPE